jgi:hypothetical protein
LYGAHIIGACNVKLSIAGAVLIAAPTAVTVAAKAYRQ